MADEQNLKLNLDAKDFLDTLKKLNEGIDGLGEPKKLQGLVGGLTQIAELGGVIGVAYLALKTSFDAVFETEQIKAINSQFEILSKNAGIAGDQLKEAMEKSANGLVDNTQLTELANKAMIQFGASAQKLPEIIELSRKMSAAGFGEITSNIEAMNQAIATGNTRLLKHLGIVIDQEKAYRKYAESIGATADTLSESGKQQAILNEVLSKGDKQFSGVDANVKETTLTWQQFIVTLKETQEAVQLVLAQALGPAVKEIANVLKDTAVNVKQWWQAWTGEGPDAAELKINNLRQTILDLQDKIAERTKLGFNPTVLTPFSESLDQLRASLVAAEGELKGLQAQQSISQTKKEEPAGGGGTGLGVDNEKKLQQEAAFNVELSKLRQERLDAQLKAGLDEEQFNKFQIEQSIALEEAHWAKVEEIENNHKLTFAQQDAAIEQLEAQHVAQMESLDEQLKQKKIQSLEAYAKKAKETNDSVSAGFKVAAAKAEYAMNDFSTQAQNNLRMVTDQAATAFTSIGEGGKKGGDILKGFIFGSLGDIAEAYGRLFLSTGIAHLAGGVPSGGVEVAEGGALLALAGFLHSQAKASGGGIPAAGGGGGGGSGGATAPEIGGGGGGSGAGPGTQAATTSVSPGLVQDYEKKQKVVNLNIQGHYFETEQTKTAIVQMVRDASDATDFNIKAVGES